MSDARCPRCAAAVRPDAPWCTLCYADLRPAPEPPPAPVPAPALAPVPAVVGAGVDPLTAPLEQVAGAGRGRHAAPAAAPTWPCSRCGTANGLDATLCAACGAGFLAGAGGDDAIRLPGVGDVRGLSRGARIGIGFAVSGVLLLVLLAVMWALGALV